MSTKPKARILVVEDDAIVRVTISNLLYDEGYDVSTANDGFDALLHLQQAVPDLLLSDLNMPQMSGFELLSVVRRRFPEILVVASSGAYDSSAIPDGVIADAFYAKGQESAANLLEIIANLLRNGSGLDHYGKPFVVLICTQCLRSFPFTVDHEPTGEVLKTPCIYCPHEVTYIIDFSRSVNSPEKRAAWKAAFLKSQKESPEVTLSRVTAEMAKPRITKSARLCKTA
jgi:CheY-like chemotaxis protein